MQKLADILAILRREKAFLHERFHVSRIGVFGSVARGEAHPDSDIDILVEFDEKIGLGFVDLAETLERILGSKVDLVSRRGLRPEVLKLIEPEIVDA